MLRALALWIVLTFVILFMMTLIAGGSFGIGTGEVAVAALVSTAITGWDTRRRRRPSLP
jgi:hypothetical protein